MTEEFQPSHGLGATVAAVLIVAMFYPLTRVPSFPETHGGPLGLAGLVIGAGLSWWAFTVNRSSPWRRRLIQLPITAWLSYWAVAEVYLQYVCSGWAAH